MSLSFVRTPHGLTTIVDSRQYDVHTTHENFEGIKQAVIDGDIERFHALFNVATKLQQAIEEEAAVCGLVEVKHGQVLYNGEVMDDFITQRILDMRREGFPIESMCKFLGNLMQNPSYNSRKQLYQFLEHECLPITDDGCFLAYKTVGHDFFSKASGNLKLTHGTTSESGRIYNGVGEYIACDRREVDDNPDNHCSKGLHVGALAYAGPGGWYNHSDDNVVIVKVNPKDVVSVPNDHDAQKVRTCAYEVLSVYEKPLDSRSATPSGELNEPEYDPWVDDYEDDFVDEQYIDPYGDLYYGALIEFDYINNDGVHLHRVAFVDDQEQDWFTNAVCELHPDDPKYVRGADNYRQFVKSKMNNVVLR